ncbi:hypothetical protein [Paenibacillus rubinfantis]|uniref:hypothetical protein n=1 Tax=Paenibacillus rubinfantis TaxID=1720296 RepID=UPI0011DCCFA6|nr:hypothetical protein [Paenibacillus rubinfantis]
MIQRMRVISMLDKGLDVKYWTPEQVAEHIRRIGAEKPPDPRNQFASQIIAPRQGRWGKYLKW